VIIKASAGGGGKGMRLAENEDMFRNSFSMAKYEAKKLLVMMKYTLKSI